MLVHLGSTFNSDVFSQWTLQWGSETEATDVEGVDGGGEDKSEVLSRVREGLMHSIPSDIMAFSIPLPCS